MKNAPVRATPDAQAQPCPTCEGIHVQRTVVTSMVVYFRCSDCACVWNIPERRAIRRQADPEPLDF
jgi:hypothetical protein